MDAKTSKNYPRFDEAGSQTAGKIGQTEGKIASGMLGVLVGFTGAGSTSV
jgi:hypothetical protein